MFKSILKYLLLLAGFIPLIANGAIVSVSFDTITYLGQTGKEVTIRGTEQNTGDPLDITIGDYALDPTSSHFKECRAYALTAMEKTGKYFFHIKYEPAYPYYQLQQCALEVKI